MAAQTFDVVVIGAGPGGYVAAIPRRPAWPEGGHNRAGEPWRHLHLNWGCIPTKALLRTAEVFHLMHRAKEFGLSATGVDFDLNAVVARSRGVAKQLSGGIGHLMKKNKITVFMGVATLPKPGTVSVKTDKGVEELTAKAIVLATGARARELPGLEADGDLVWTYRHALQPKRMPKKLLVIGSGAIGIEFASFFNTLGADTHGRGSDGPRAAGRGRRDQRFCQEGVRQAGDEDPRKDHAVKKTGPFGPGKVVAYLEDANGHDDAGI